MTFKIWECPRCGSHKWKTKNDLSGKSRLMKLEVICECGNIFIMDQREDESYQRKLQKTAEKRKKDNEEWEKHFKEASK